MCCGLHPACDRGLVWERRTDDPCSTLRNSSHLRAIFNNFNKGTSQRTYPRRRHRNPTTVIQGASSVEFLCNCVVLTACHTKFGSFTLWGIIWGRYKTCPLVAPLPQVSFPAKFGRSTLNCTRQSQTTPKKPLWEPSSPVVDVFKIDTFCPQSTICRSTTFLP